MGNEFNELEKTVVRLETQLAMISETFLGGILRLEKKLDEREQNYVTKDILESKLEIRDREISRLQEDKKSNKQLLPTWIQSVLAAVAILVSLYAILQQ